MRLLVCGGRDFDNAPFLNAYAAGVESIYARISDTV